MVLMGPAARNKDYLKVCFRKHLDYTSVRTSLLQTLPNQLMTLSTYPEMCNIVIRTSVDCAYCYRGDARQHKCLDPKMML